MIRTIITAIVLVGFFIITLPLLGILWILGHFFPEAIDRISFRILRGEARFVVFCAGVKLTVIGADNIPADSACLFVSNHRSYFDIIVSLALAKSMTGFVAKQELNRIPSLRIWMKRIKCVFLNRDDAKAGLQVILDAAQNIKSGFSMYIFPEGHRFHDDYLHEFKGGSFKIATKTGCPIIPVAIYGADDVFENHIPIVKSTQVIYQYGAPVYANELSKEDKKRLAPYISNIINDMLKENTPYKGLPAPKDESDKNENL